jgi:hypothetical protein
MLEDSLNECREKIRRLKYALEECEAAQIYSRWKTWRVWKVMPYCRELSKVEEAMKGHCQPSVEDKNFMTTFYDEARDIENDESSTRLRGSNAQSTYSFKDLSEILSMHKSRLKYIFHTCLVNDNIVDPNWLTGNLDYFNWPLIADRLVKDFRYLGLDLSLRRAYEQPQVVGGRRGILLKWLRIFKEYYFSTLDSFRHNVYRARWYDDQIDPYRYETQQCTHSWVWMAMRESRQ